MSQTGGVSVICFQAQAEMAAASKRNRVGNDTELKPIRSGGSPPISPHSNISEAWSETNVSINAELPTGSADQAAGGKRNTVSKRKLDVEMNPSNEETQPGRKSKLYGWLLSEFSDQ